MSHKHRAAASHSKTPMCDDDHHLSLLTEKTRQRLFDFYEQKQKERENEREDGIEGADNRA